MFDSVYALEYVKFEMLSKERIEGEMMKSHSVGVVQYQPRKIFIRGFDEEKVLLNELLYVAGENEEKVLISPNGFPYFNLNLDPLGSTMRNNHHLTILEAGGRYLVDMLKLGLDGYVQNGDQISDRFTLYKENTGEIKLVLNNKDYEIRSYKIEQKQSIRDFCFIKGISEYKMIEINEGMEISDHLEIGQEVKIPNMYAKKFELIIRESDYVPLQVRIFDDQGLFAEYKYLEFNTDPIISNQTFSSGNPAYTF
jgi:outer membrane lipoprotein-sorting protein